MGEHAEDDDAPAHRRMRRAYLAGAVPSLLLFAWVLTIEGGSLLQRQYFDDFYDVQARALFDGHLDVPPEVVGFEGFEVDGRTYIYFGPLPALLRMPLLALTDRFDGRLTTLSMLTAAIVLAAAAFRLTTALRTVVRGPRVLETFTASGRFRHSAAKVSGSPVSRREQWAMAGLAVAVLTGAPMFMASAAVVYHEATLWGLALTVAAYDAVLRWLTARSRPVEGDDHVGAEAATFGGRFVGWLRSEGGRLVVAAVTVGLALQTRLTIATGPLVALALGGVWLAVRDRRQRDVRWLAAVAAACLVPLALAGAVNQAKFGRPLGVPLEHQTNVEALGNRAEVLATNPSYVGVEYVPTTLLAYLRPDGIDLRTDFPWFDFPRSGPHTVGDVTFDELDWTSSLPATTPALTALTVGAVVWSTRSRLRRRRSPAAGAADQRTDWDDADEDASDHSGDPAAGVGTGSRCAPLWPLLAGAVVGASTVLVFPYVANRYLLDLYPVVLLGGIVGFHAASRLARRWQDGALAGTALLVGLGALVNLALALEFQHERGPVIPEHRRADWVAWRLDLPGSPEARTIGRDERLPPVADGDLLAVGDCDGLYVGVRDLWVAVERGPGVGVHDLRIDDVDRLRRGVRYPVATFGDGDQTTVVALVRLDDGSARIDVLGPAFFEDGWRLGDEPIAIDGDEPLVLRLDADPRQRTANVYHRERVVNAALLPSRPPFDDPTPSLGTAPPREGVEPTIPADVTAAPESPDLCHQATR